MLQEIVVGSNMDKIYLVMDYVEHDMKSLMESLREPFLTGASHVGIKSKPNAQLLQAR